VPRARAQALLDQGYSVAAAARHLGVSRTTLRRELKRVAEKVSPNAAETH
jgi:IS30 family transposase